MLSFFRRCLSGLVKEKALAAAYAAVIAAGFLHLGLQSAASAATVQTFAMPANNKIVVIDAGHGGWDPGMIGATKTIEKNINLAIAEKLQRLLEMGGAVALVTRAEDEALGDSKREDLKARTDLTERADLFISIHQNQYPQSSVRGAQTFYNPDSPDGKLLAEHIQRQVFTYLDSSNKRAAKANADYYLLRKSSSPSVIVECGFLSNVEEEKLLTDADYQERVAWTIYLGILNYLSEK